jgi:hypothetical protein
MKLLMLAFFLLPLPSNIGQQISSSATIFDKVLPKLQQKTRVPIKLSSYIAAEEETNPLYAIITKATSNGYELELAFTTDCGGANVCHYGIVSGTIALGSKRPRGKPVKLVRGITGYFIDAKCDWTCTDSTLTWQQAGHRYTVGIKAADVDTLRKVANSAID